MDIDGFARGQNVPGMKVLRPYTHETTLQIVAYGAAGAASMELIRARSWLVGVNVLHSSRLDLLDAIEILESSEVTLSGKFSPGPEAGSVAMAFEVRGKNHEDLERGLKFVEKSVESIRARELTSDLVRFGTDWNLTVWKSEQGWCHWVLHSPPRYDSWQETRGSTVR